MKTMISLVLTKMQHNNNFIANEIYVFCTPITHDIYSINLNKL